MAKAEATDNRHEAEAFARKAAELIAQHRIDPAQLTSPIDADDLVVREIALGRGAYVRARLALLMAVADAHDARVVFGPAPDGTVAYVAGFAADLEIVEVLYQSLHTQAAAQMAVQRRSTGAATQRFRRSFLFGYADRMRDLLAESRHSVESTGRSQRGSHIASVVALRERSRRVEEFAGEAFGSVRSARAPAGAQPQGFLAGVEAADRADVGRTRLAGRRALGRG